jgi:hypothetical protein
MYICCKTCNQRLGLSSVDSVVYVLYVQYVLVCMYLCIYLLLGKVALLAHAVIIKLTRRRDGGIGEGGIRGE